MTPNVSLAILLKPLNRKQERGGRHCRPLCVASHTRTRSEVELESQLKDARIAHGARINAKGRRSEGGVGDDKVRMIENVEGLGTKRQAVFLCDRELLAEIHIPILFKGPVNNISAEVAEERAPGGADRERLIAWSAVDVEAGNYRPAW